MKHYYLSKKKNTELTNQPSMQTKKSLNNSTQSKASHS